jgi:hypothetical protein
LQEWLTGPLREASLPCGCQQVDELEGFCNALCSQMFDEEFVDA